MAEYGLLLRMPFFSTLVKYAAEKAGEGGTGAHLEVGTVPQQVPRAPTLSMVTLNSRGAGARELVWNTVRFCCRSGGPQALSTALSYIIQPGSGLD